jgi:hypothetical protein
MSFLTNTWIVLHVVVEILHDNKWGEFVYENLLSVIVSSRQLHLEWTSRYLFNKS